MRPNQKAARERWMSRFSDCVVALDSRHAGKIEWDTAVFFYNENRTAEDAAQQYVETRREGKPT